MGEFLKPDFRKLGEDIGGINIKDIEGLPPGAFRNLAGNLFQGGHAENEAGKKYAKALKDLFGLPELFKQELYEEKDLLKLYDKYTEGRIDQVLLVEKMWKSLENVRWEDKIKE
jgi:hypothetical protein